MSAWVHLFYFLNNILSAEIPGTRYQNWNTLLCHEITVCQTLDRHIHAYVIWTSCSDHAMLVDRCSLTLDRSLRSWVQVMTTRRVLRSSQFEACILSLHIEHANHDFVPWPQSFPLLGQVSSCRGFDLKVIESRLSNAEGNSDEDNDEVVVWGGNGGKLRSNSVNHQRTAGSAVKRRLRDDTGAWQQGGRNRAHGKAILDKLQSIILLQTHSCACVRRLLQSCALQSATWVFLYTNLLVSTRLNAALLAPVFGSVNWDTSAD